MIKKENFLCDIDWFFVCDVLGALKQHWRQNKDSLFYARMETERQEANTHTHTNQTAKRIIFYLLADFSHPHPEASFLPFISSFLSYSHPSIVYTSDFFSSYFIYGVT